MLNLVKSLFGTWLSGLSDSVGRKPLIVAGWLLYAAVYFGFSRATAPWHAWALIATYGLFYAMTEGTEKALVADIVPKTERGVAFGWYNLAIGLGALPASLIFGAIWDRLGAPVAFMFGASLALFGCGRNGYRCSGESCSFDVAGVSDEVPVVVVPDFNIGA